MYTSHIHLAPNEEAVRSFLQKHGFGTLVSEYGGAIMSTHAVMLYEEEEDHVYLYGHIAAANEQVKSIQAGTEHLAIFMDHHAYVSSSWYDHINVPSWNYVAVHCYGQIEALDDEAAYHLLDKVTKKYEHDRTRAFDISQMDTDSLKAHIKGQQSFRMHITRIEANWKLSQNRSDQDYHNIITMLRKEGDAMSIRIADEMQKLRSSKN